MKKEKKEKIAAWIWKGLGRGEGRKKASGRVSEARRAGSGGQAEGGRERMIKSANTSTSGGVCLFSDCKTMTVVLQNLKIAFRQILLQLLGKLLSNK